MRAAKKALAIKIIVAMVMLAIISLGTAQPAAAETKVSVSSPSGGTYVDSKPIYVIVTVSPDQAIKGTITINNNSGQLVATKDFEASGGSIKEILVRAPTIDYGLTVLVKASDGTDERFDNAFRSMDLGQPVGLSPALVSASNPKTVPIRGGSRSGILSPFDPTWLDYGPEVLGHHNALLMAEVDFELLTEKQQQSLFFWVTRGGSLVIDSPVDSPPTGLPVAFNGAGKADHGAGTISLSGGAVAAGDFEGVISPRLIAISNPNPSSYTANNGINALIDDAVIPSIPFEFLIPVMALYVLAIGPGAWLWLRKRKGLPKLWLIVPAVAVISTVGIWGLGTALRGASSGAHVTLVADYAGMTETRSQFIVSTAAGGFTGIELEDGWGQDSVFDLTYDPYSGEQFQEAVQRGDEVGVDLPPGSSTVTGASRIGSGNPSWDVEIERNDEGFSGTVTNLSNYRLEDVVVAVSDGGKVIPKVDRGETVSFTLEGSTGTVGNVHSQVTRRLDPGSDESTSPGLYQQWSSAIPNAKQGHVVVIGWSTEPAGPLRSNDGETFNAGRTGFVSMAKLPAESTNDNPIGAVTVTNEQWYGDGDLLDGGSQLYPEIIGTYQFEVKKDLSDSELIAIDFTGQMIAADIWDGSNWIRSGLASSNSGTASTLGISPEFVVDGVVTFRVGMYPEGSANYDEEAEVPVPSARLAEPTEDLTVVEAG